MSLFEDLERTVQSIFGEEKTKPSTSIKKPVKRKRGRPRKPKKPTKPRSPAQQRASKTNIERAKAANIRRKRAGKHVGRPKGAKGKPRKTKPQPPSPKRLMPQPKQKKTREQRVLKTSYPRTAFDCAEAYRVFSREITNLADVLEEANPDLFREGEDPTERNDAARHQQGLKTALDKMANDCGCIPSNGGCLISVKRTWRQPIEAAEVLGAAIKKSDLNAATEALDELGVAMRVVFAMATK